MKWMILPLGSFASISVVVFVVMALFRDVLLIAFVLVVILWHGFAKWIKKLKKWLEAVSSKYSTYIMSSNLRVLLKLIVTKSFMANLQSSSRLGLKDNSTQCP